MYLNNPISIFAAKYSVQHFGYGLVLWDFWLLYGSDINPLVPDAHYNERQNNQFSLQIQQLEVDLKLNCGF